MPLNRVETVTAEGPGAACLHGEPKDKGPRQYSSGGAPISIGCRVESALDRHNILGGRALLALNHIEVDLLTLGERLEALALNRAVVAEDILLAVVAGDEAEALLVVEPLYSSGRTQSCTP